MLNVSGLRTEFRIGTAWHAAVDDVSFSTGYQPDREPFEIGRVRIFFVKDPDGTPVEFIVSLLRTVFAHSERQAQFFVAQLNEQGSSACGPYPA